MSDVKQVDYAEAARIELRNHSIVADSRATSSKATGSEPDPEESHG
jgi:hypothetical protein